MQRELTRLEHRVLRKHCTSVYTSLVPARVNSPEDSSRCNTRRNVGLVEGVAGSQDLYACC